MIYKTCTSSFLCPHALVVQEIVVARVPLRISTHTNRSPAIKGMEIVHLFESKIVYCKNWEADKFANRKLILHKERDFAGI